MYESSMAFKIALALLENGRARLREMDRSKPLEDEFASAMHKIINIDLYSALLTFAIQMNAMLKNGGESVKAVSENDIRSGAKLFEIITETLRNQSINSDKILKEAKRNARVREV